jgi:hypothetical protein
VSDRELILRAAALARSAPRQFTDFLEALSAYSDYVTQNCIQSPLQELPRAQGRAQQAALLHGILADCIKRADQIEGKKK